MKVLNFQKHLLCISDIFMKFADFFEFKSLANNPNKRFYTTNICVIIDIDFKSMVYLLARAAEICRPHLLYFIIILFPHSASKSLSKFSMSSPSFLQEEKEKEKNLNSGPPS